MSNTSGWAHSGSPMIRRRLNHCGVLGDLQQHEAVGALEEAPRDDAAHAVLDGQLPGVEPDRQRGRQDRRGGRLGRHVDALAAAVDEPGVQRAEHASARRRRRGPRRTRRGSAAASRRAASGSVALTDSRPPAASASRSLIERSAAVAPNVEIVATIRPGLAASAAASAASSNQPLAAGGRLDDDVRGDRPARRRRAAGVGDDGALAGGEVGEAGAALRVGDAADVRAAMAQRVARPVARP